MRAFILTIPLAACVSANEPPPSESATQPRLASNMTHQQLSEKMYQLRLEHDPKMPQSMADAMMDQRAVTLCPTGYDKLSDSSGEQAGATEWWIRCR